MATIEIQKASSAPETTKSVNIRHVPVDVWQRARLNSLRSGVPFRTYVIRVLTKCEPILE